MITYPDKEKIELKFDNEKHSYMVGKDKVLSVTKIIDSIVPKPNLVQWSAKMGADWWLDNFNNESRYVYNGIANAYKLKSDAALKVGSIVHDYIENAIKWSLASDSNNDEPAKPEDEEALNSIKAFGEWIKANDVEWISAEEKIYSRKYKYAGTVDAVALVDGELSVIDFKTSKQIYKSYKLQIYAYKQAIEEIYGEEIKRCFILRFDKSDGKFQAREIKDNYLPAFLKGLDFLNEYKRRR